MSQAQRLAVLLPVDAALCACRRFDLPAGGVTAFRQGQTVPVALEIPETCVSMRRTGISGFGRNSGGGPLGPAATYFVGRRIVLEGGCRDAYNARLLKRSKLLIEV